MGAENEDNQAHVTAAPARIVSVTATSAATPAVVKAHLAERTPARGAMLRATVASPVLGRVVMAVVLRGPALALAEAVGLEAAGLGAAAAGANYRSED